MNYELFSEIFTHNFQSLLALIEEFVPRLIVTIGILLLGYVVARLLSKFIEWVMKNLGVDRFSKTSGLEEILLNCGIQKSLGQLLALFVFWFAFMLSLMSAADILKLQSVSQALNRLLNYLPHVFGAFVIFMISAVAGSFVKNMVIGAGERMNWEAAKPLSRIVYFAFLLIGSLLALSQLQIETTFLTQLIQIVVCGIFLALALSLGIGSRDISKNLISGVYLRESLSVGSYVKIGDHEGLLVAVRPICFEIQDESGKSIIMPNSKLLEVEIIHQDI